MMVPENIIVRMPNWIGDAVCGTPVLAALRRAYPTARVTAMCQGTISALFERDPAINELFRFRRAESFLNRMRDRSVIAKLRTGKYDLGLLLTHSFSSAWRLWQGRVKMTVGFAGDGRRFLLDCPLKFPKKKEHMVETYKRLLTPLGISGAQIKPRLFITEEEQKKAWEVVKRFDISPKQTLIAINPGAAYGSAKCWLPDRFRELAARIVAYDSSYRVLFFGSLMQKELVNQICAGLPPRVVNLAGQTSLRELMALIGSAAVLVTNDSGPMHIADSLGVPLVALFGSTDPLITGPYCHPNAVLAAQPPCSPCFNRVCPIDFRCMKAIQVKAVFDKVLSKLKPKA
ncbi:MAG: lipopolysaccharide heptosyltransferase II [Chlamydiota bacterium]